MTVQEKKKYRVSPKYPYYSLKDCVKNIEALYKKDGLGEVDKTLAMEHMGLDPNNDWSARATASITGFNLLIEKGPSTNRVFQLTDIGNIIAMSKNMTSQKKDALRQAAFSYEIIKKLSVDKWPSGLPSEEAIKIELVINGFAKRAAGRFASVFRETYEFAQLGKSDQDLGTGESINNSSGKGVVNSPSNIPDNTDEYIMTLANNKVIRLYISTSLTNKEYEFMLNWIDQLDLTNSRDNNQEMKDEDIPF